MRRYVTVKWIGEQLRESDLRLTLVAHDRCITGTKHLGNLLKGLRPQRPSPPTQDDPVTFGEAIEQSQCRRRSVIRRRIRPSPFDGVSRGRHNGAHRGRTALWPADQ
ncbi:hypothetical protein MSM1_20310 [Mycobacterium sp. SM1]|uniref:hypothetical protein n=1 Tax=Mycobacterium sp. SM1 TaxID=2816243 RepID=UPI001BCAE28D|nr:hypothetical protein [Mycobacterium sp. SM1]MBS4730563.1 hypothetical protein [Mycobacterium sp. SM1]